MFKTFFSSLFYSFVFLTNASFPADVNPADQTSTTIADQPAKPLDVLLFIALPASGKSELRRYLDNLNAETALKEFGIKKTVQLDDFPYVHFMRLVSDEMIKQGLEGAFFRSPVLPFKDPNEWNTLIQLINLEYEDIALNRPIKASSAADWLFARIDRARKKNQNEPIFSKFSPALRRNLATALETEAEKIKAALNQNIAQGLKDKTVVIEFARGGATASAMPLPAPYGYQHALAELSPQILEKAAILYIKVDPKDSLKKNTVRSNPNDPGSILNHKVPLAVMYTEYGCDDLAYLKSQSTKTNTLCIKQKDKIYFLPIGIFDNRDDKTTFLREEVKLWPKDKLAKLEKTLKQSFLDLRSAQK